MCAGSTWWGIPNWERIQVLRGEALANTRGRESGSNQGPVI